MSNQAEVGLIEVIFVINDRNPKNHLSTQTGAGVVWLLAILPLLLSLTLAIGGAFIFMRLDAETRHLCRSALLEAQRIPANNLNALIALNPAAKLLRKRRMIAEEQVLKAAGNPIVEAAALANLSEVTAEQILFGARQQVLYRQAQALTLIGSERPRAPITSAINNLIRWLATGGGTWPEFSIQHARFVLKTSPPLTLTPDYEIPKSFEVTQQMTARWSLRAAKIIPHWMSAFIKTDEFTFRAECTSTIRKLNGPRLGKGIEKWIPSLETRRLNANGLDTIQDKF